MTEKYEEISIERGQYDTPVDFMKEIRRAMGVDSLPTPIMSTKTVDSEGIVQQVTDVVLAGKEGKVSLLCYGTGGSLTLAVVDASPETVTQTLMDDAEMVAIAALNIAGMGSMGREMPPGDHEHPDYVEPVPGEQEEEESK